ncbi:MAG: hypothetical protein FVQ77_01275 [Cytophagales bacterium]|nr:hypothetical protein [Cytophagales bacterium]
MTKIELSIPDRFSNIDPELRDKLLTGALREVAAIQLKEKEVELGEAKKNILKFEQIYHGSFEGFKKTLPKNADHKLHEDFVEWSFWNDVFNKAQSLVKDLRFVLGKSND